MAVNCWRKVSSSEGNAAAGEQQGNLPGIKGAVMIGRLSIMKNHNERIEHFSCTITVPYLTSHEICQLFGDSLGPQP